MLLCTRMQRYCLPRHGWTSPTTCGRCCSWAELMRRASPLWKSSIMGPTLTWNFWEFRSYRGPCECLSWSHHVYGDTCRGGFRFPFVGIWAKTAVLAQTGEGPQAVWDNYHGCEEIFELLGVLPRELTGNRSCLGMCALWWRDWR